MDPGQAEWIERYLDHLRLERRLSRHTASNYARDLRAVLAFCEQQQVARWRDLHHHLIRAFVAAGHRSGLAPRSLQRRLSALRSFLAYLLREGEVRANPAREVSAPKVKRRLPGTLDADQMTQLLQVDGDEPLARRDRAIMELLYSSGLRLAELVGLDLEDLDLTDATARVEGKGGKVRIVPVGRFARAALDLWLQERTRLADVAERAVFVSCRGQRLSGRSVQARVRLWAQRRGVSQRVYPHLFRHSFATHILESSGDLRGVQELLGHADIATTQVYTHLDFQHLARIYDEAHPRARKRRKPTRDDASQ